jgi:uncharacterized protein YkwD
MKARVTSLIALVLPFLAPGFCHAQAPSPRPTLRVADRTLGSESRVSDATANAVPIVQSDPYGFIAVLNQYRAQAGLPPVAFDPDLSAWASQNNVVQSHKGIGHHVNPNCYQNSAWNCVNAWDVAQAWMNSPGHRRNMLSPSISRVGIAYGPGPYWTMNAR